MTRKRAGRSSLPSTLGGIVVGFEYDVWKRQPPPHELVRKGQPVRGTAADGTDLTIELPDAPITARHDRDWPAPVAVLLDLDGLSIDSEPIHLEATRRALAHWDIVFDASVIGPYYGQPTEVSCRAIAAEHGIDGDELFARRTREFERLIEAGIPFRPGLVEGCTLLAEAGVKIGLVSSGLRRYVERAAQAMRDAGVRLDVVISVDDVVHPKPDPEPYLAAAARLGAHPRACVVFEDAPAGLQSARDAGMRCVVVPNDHTRGGDFRAADAIEPDLVAAARWVLDRVHAD